MGRRFHRLIGTTLAVAGLGLATGTALARQDDPLPAPAPSPPGARPLELPPLAAPDAAPADLGPEATPYTPPGSDDAPKAPAAPDAGAGSGDRPSVKLPLPARLKGLLGGAAAASKKGEKSPAPAASPEAGPNPSAEPGTPAEPKAAPDPDSVVPPELAPAPAMPPPPGADAPAPAPPPVSPPAPEAEAQAVGEQAAPVDDAVEKVQAVGTPPATGPRKPAAPAHGPAPTAGPADGRRLPPAVEKPGQPAPAPEAAPGGAPREPEPSFILPPEKLPLGKQSVGLTVEVVAPQFLNINQTAALKVVVRNTGTTDAKGVVVRDTLPPNLTYVASQPDATRIDALLSWNLGEVPAGSERVISLSVKPTATGAFDHAATVSMAAGARSRTVVREPRLKVEQAASSGKVLRGQPVQFRIAVSNPGDGPAHNVLVQAKLSPGLRHESGEPNDQNLFEQTIDVIGPGERVSLETLVADTTLGGEQSCTVAVSSPDVIAGAPDARSVQALTVVEPKLTLKVAGPKERYTDTLGTYEVTLENPGSAAAKNVRVAATLPVSGRLQGPLQAGARFDASTRKLTWTRTQLDAGEKAVLSFQVRMGGVGLYAVAAEARADGVSLAKDVFQTDVSGLADVDFNVTEKRRVVDINGETIYTIRVVNNGTKEATRLAISAILSDNIRPEGTSGTDTPAKWNEKDTLMFPTIERLGPGKSIELGIKVRATKSGIATCRVYLTHDDLDQRLDDVAAFKVTALRR